MNDSNRYIIVLYGLKAKDFKNLDNIIANSIRETLLDECIKSEIVEQFIIHSPGITYAQTKDRSLVARMNKACDNVFFYGDVLNSDIINQSAVSMKASSLLVGDGNKDYMHPNEVMYMELEVFAKEPVFRCESVELLVTLDLENHHIWRKIIVPIHITFKKLHDVLQIVFGWKDYHLHDFYVLEEDKPIINLVCSEEAFEYQDDIPMIMETKIKLSEYIPRYTMMKYTYDFGDNWEHTIEAGNILENHTKSYPECLEGEGNSPPEDVGGEGGYDEYLKAVSDSQHPEHRSMIDWAEGQYYQGFDIKSVNRRLKNILIGTWER
ncbi:MAG TPA: plasmid pRiA4b ORF-3 family protein [Bacilli bacterium]